MNRFKIGYTQGVFDILHIGHINLINHAKQYCDYLIVGINSDQLVLSYKHKTPIINEEDRKTIIENLKAVDECIVVDTLDKVKVLTEHHFDAIFIGDDWKGNMRWIKTEKDLAEFQVPVIYLPHTDGISSTILRPLNGKRIEE